MAEALAGMSDERGACRTVLNLSDALPVSLRPLRPLRQAVYRIFAISSETL
jgi:hypothetical protein